MDHPLGEHASVIALDLLCGHKHATTVAAQDGRLVQGGEGVGFECVSTRFSCAQR